MSSCADKPAVADSTFPLVLLPGFMLDQSLWDDVLSRLRYDAPICCLPLAPGATTEEIAAGVAHAAPERFVLIGFSLGGYIARKVAELFPERVVALVLIATSLRVDSEERAKARQDVIAALNPATFRGLSMHSIAHSLHPDRRGDKELVARIREMGNRLGYQAMVVQSNLDRGGIAAATLTCPTLVIAAADDPLRSAEEAQELAAAIPHSTLKTIAHSGHMLPLEQPELLAETISQWLGSLAGSIATGGRQHDCASRSALHR
ncbi:alpha/beta hydrolase [Massilia agilis]|uniref:Alpha/beta hydrolase n=1 Tax=Massilia agilis TaxID=1811226 RepID=A0ABT2DCK7_9BURK|nr:alpha/beta hydrolase [Massilia agilis]MCS0808976.1 alpha/beta hydrolase [Massilia agilis]